MKPKFLMVLIVAFIGGTLLTGCDPDETPTADAPVIQTGEQVFAANCAACHGQDAGGNVGPNLHNLDLSKAKIAATVKKGKGKMPAFGEMLTAAQQEQVVNYITSLKSAPKKP